MRLAVSLLALALTGACYDVPKPDCGFRCGPDGACPADYACSATDNYCHLVGSPVTICATAADASVDVGTGEDAPLEDAPLEDAPLEDAALEDAPPEDAPLDLDAAP